MNIEQYINLNKVKINNQYRHQYHMMAPIGWINDPNGFSFYLGNYHMFYQYYPYDTKWGLMHWGHSISRDLIKWEECPVALAPSKDYDQSGIFSGSAIQIDNNLYLYYTGHNDSHMNQELCDDNLVVERMIKQVQCLAISNDGINFEKVENNPIIGLDQIPKETRMSDFRDPKVWEKNGTYYMAVGSGNQEGKGQVLFYVSLDGKEWSYLNKFSPNGDYGYVCECPDLFELGGKDIMIVSFQGKNKEGYNFQNVHCVLAFIGSFDYATGYYIKDAEFELDAGFDFYAPQTMLDSQGRRIMMAFMHMFQRTFILDELGHGWIGSLTLPRTLQLIDGKILQKPIDEIQSYRCNEVIHHSIVIEGEKKIEGIIGIIIELEISLTFDQGTYFEIEFFKSENESLRLILNKSKGNVELDRSVSGYIIESLNCKNDYKRHVELDLNNKVSMRCFLDVSSIEVFLNEGEKVLSSLCYPQNGGIEIVFRTDGKVIIDTLKKWDLTVK